MNVLAIGAHFDDIELGCGGTLAKHKAGGDRVISQVVTHSKYHNHDGILMREKEKAFREGEKAAGIIGCELICNNYETKQVRFGYELIEDINRVIDNNKIDLIYTHWDHDIHQDHQAIGKASLAAGRKVNRLLMYQSNLYTNTTSFVANYFVDISDFIEVKKKSIMAHKTEVKKFGSEWVDFWINEAANNGKKFSVKYAESFQLVKFLSM
ncbi:PIG-L deacetylase family protein [Candidatus Omnitrophota bacterium]